MGIGCILRAIEQYFFNSSIELVDIIFDIIGIYHSVVFHITDIREPHYKCYSWNSHSSRINSNDGILITNCIIIE